MYCTQYVSVHGSNVKMEAIYTRSHVHSSFSFLLSCFSSSPLLLLSSCFFAVRMCVCACVFRYLHLSVSPLREIKCCSDFYKDSHRQPLNLCLLQLYLLLNNRNSCTIPPQKKLSHSHLSLWFSKMMFEFLHTIKVHWCVSRLVIQRLLSLLLWGL